MQTISTTKTASFVNVTPALAAKWLESNTNNRKQRGSYISDIASAMRRGEWQATHQGIAFAKCGKLLDGQHRLEALLRAKVDLDMLVVTGLDEAAFSVIDVGAKRSIADTTKLSKRTAEVSKLIVKRLLGFNQPSAAQVSEVAQAGVEGAHEKLLSYCGSTRAFYASASVRGAAVTLVLAGHDTEKVFKNYANLVLENYSEMNGMSQSLVRLVNAGNLGSKDQRITYTHALKALNPDNEQLTRLRILPEDVDAAIAYGRAVIKSGLIAA